MSLQSCTKPLKWSRYLFSLDDAIILTHFHTFCQRLDDGSAKAAGGFPSQRSSNAENVSISRRHHGKIVRQIPVCLFIYWIHLFQAYKLEPLIDPPISNNSTTATPQYTYSCLDHLISRFIIINILHSIAYAYSFYTLRVAEPEQLVSLMERVSKLESSASSNPISLRLGNPCYINWCMYMTLDPFTGYIIKG